MASPERVVPASILAAWGLDASAQLGIKSCCAPVAAPVAVNTTIRFTDAAGGDRHSLAVAADGTVWSWGSNDAGQLGLTLDGTVQDPTQIPKLTGITLVAAGTAHSLALAADGTVWAWGDNAYGDLGDGNTTPSEQPLHVKGLAHVVQVAASDDISVALRTDGTVWAWGNNEAGQLGNGSKTNSDVPVQVKNLSHVSYIAAGGDHVLAIDSGKVWAWGDNTDRVLGTTGTVSNVPVQVHGPGGSGTLSGVIALAAGLDHSMALAADGTVWAWGGFGAGQLGDGRQGVTGGSYPVRAHGLTGIVAISAAGNHSLALDVLGNLWSWGANGQGQLGIGLRSSGGCACVAVPTAIRGVVHARGIAAGPFHSLALADAVTSLPPPPQQPAVCAGVARARKIPGAILGGNAFHAIAVSESTRHVFVLNGETYDQRTGRRVCTSSLSTLDGRTGRLLRTARLGLGAGSPAGGEPPLLVDDPAGRVLVLSGGNVTNGFAGTITFLGTGGGTVRTLAVGKRPATVSVDSRSYRAFVSGPGALRTVAVTRGSLLATRTLPNPGRLAAVDEPTGRLFLAGDGPVTMADATNGRPLTVLRLQAGIASGLAADQSLARIAVGLSGAGRSRTGSLTILESRRSTIVRAYPEGASAQIGPIVADPSVGQFLVEERHATDEAAGVTVRDARDGHILQRLALSLGPSSVDSRTGRLITISATNTVTELDPQTWQVIRTVRVGKRLTAVALDQGTNRVYLIDAGAGAVRVICENVNCR